MNVVIVGGGASCHLLAVLLANRGHSVRILTSRPGAWCSELELETDEETFKGSIDCAVADPVKAFDRADVAFLCMPVHQYHNALNSIVPGLLRNPQCIVGTVYGQGGFDWMVKDVCRKNSISGLRYFAIGLLPWIVRTKVYGKSSVSFGPKLRNGIACSDVSVFDILQSNILDDLSFNYWGRGRFELVPNFITLTLTVDNQIIHPSRCFALTRSSCVWEREEEIPYFYRDFDDYSANILKGVDEDYTCIRKAYFSRVPNLENPYNLDYLGLEHWSYGSHNPDIRASFINSSTLNAIRPPIVETSEGKFRLDENHRFFKDDFAYGLEIARWFADELGCKVPHISALIDWYERFIKPLQNNKIDSGIPTRYGDSKELVGL